jgi:hypothetical protein
MMNVLPLTSKATPVISLLLIGHLLHAPASTAGR